MRSLFPLSDGGILAKSTVITQVISECYPYLECVLRQLSASVAAVSKDVMGNPMRLPQ